LKDIVHEAPAGFVTIGQAADELGIAPESVKARALRSVGIRLMLRNRDGSAEPIVSRQLVDYAPQPGPAQAKAVLAI
jgi:hypothetical protein